MRVSFGACVRACVSVRVPDTGVLRTRNRSGVKVPGYESGYFVGPTVLADVKPHMSCYTEEIFGPVRGARSARALGGLPRASSVSGAAEE